MPFDGNGNWTSNYYPQSGELIKASDFNNTFIADIANGFGNCVTRDGQGVMQTNTNANNYRVINVADPVNNKDAVNLQTANTKDALCVHLAGEETITGDKDFTGETTVATVSSAYDHSTKSVNTEWFRNAISTLSAAHLTSYETIASNIGSYTAPIDGFIDIVIGATYNWAVYINGKEIQRQDRWSGDAVTTTHVFIPVIQGDVLTWYVSAGAFYGGTMYHNY